MTSNIFEDIHSCYGSRLSGAVRTCVDIITQVKPILARLKAASIAGHLPAGKPEQLIAPALIAGLMTAAEAQLVLDAELARKDAIQVDAFTVVEYGSVKERTESKV